MCFDFICVTIVVGVGFFKKLHLIHTTLILCWCLITNSSGVNLTTYYDIVSILNTKNNHIVVIFFIWVTLLTNIKVFSNSNPSGLTTTLVLLWVIGMCCMYAEPTDTHNTIILKNLSPNLNLLNGIMLVHPPILYVSYAIILYIIYFSIHKMHTKYTLSTTKQFIYIITTLIIFSNTLGCWWAEQELTWGGWWSWDLVEVLLLNILVYFLFKLHSKHQGLNNVSSFKKIFFSYKCSVFVVITTISVRYDFINSIHNFTNSQIQNQHYYIFCLTLFILLLCTNKNLSILQPLIKNFQYSIVSIFFGGAILLFIPFYVMLVITPFISDHFLYTDRTLKSIYYVIVLYIIAHTQFSLWDNTNVQNLFLKKIYFNPMIVLLSAVVFCFLDYVCMYVLVLIIFKKSKNCKNLINFLKLNVFHKSIIYLFLILLHQTYVFVGDLLLLYTYNDSILLKISNQTIFRIYQQIVFVNNYYPITNSLEIATHMYDNGGMYLTLSTLFEKSLHLKLQHLLEMYNFDLQTIYQNINFVLCWFSVPFFLLIISTLTFFKRFFL